MSETTYLKELVVVEDGIAYKFKGVSLSDSNASTILDDLISEYTEKYNNLNTQVTALENQLELGQVKFVTDMTTLNTEQLVNTLYVNDEVVGIVDDGSGIIPQVYLKDGSSVSLKEVERKEEDADDGAEYLGYVNKQEYAIIDIPIIELQGIETGSQVLGNEDDSSLGDLSYIHQYNNYFDLGIKNNTNLLSILGISISNVTSSNLKITRMDTSLSIQIGTGYTNMDNTVYMWSGDETTSSFITSEDIGKTIQIKIEKVS